MIQADSTLKQRLLCIPKTFCLGYFNCIPFSARLVSVSLPLGRNNPVTTFEVDRVISQMLSLRHTNIENSEF